MREEKEGEEVELADKGRVDQVLLIGKKWFWSAEFRKQIVKCHCKSWMHLQEVELESTKIKSIKLLSPADLDNLLPSRQGDGAVRATAGCMERKNKKGPHSSCSPQTDTMLWEHRKLICLHTLPILACLYFCRKRSVFSRITAHALCLCLLNKKKGSPSTILMMDW